MNPALRRRDLAKLHLLARDAGLIKGQGKAADKSAYVRLLLDRTGYCSAADLDDATLRSVIQHVQGLAPAARPAAGRGAARGAGATDGRTAAAAQRPAPFQALSNGVPGYPGRPHNADVESRKEIRKIEALLTTLGKPWSYAEAICERVTHGAKRHIEFCDAAELAALVGALSRTAGAQLTRALDAELQRQGLAWADAQTLAVVLFGMEPERNVSRYVKQMSWVLDWLQGRMSVWCVLADGRREHARQ